MFWQWSAILRESTRAKEYIPNIPIPVLISLTGIIKILKFENKVDKKKFTVF